jgi:hypothetical protein
MHTALVVEKHAGLRQAIIKLLKGMGVGSIDAPTIDEAKERIYDIVITTESNVKHFSDHHVTPVIVLSPFRQCTDGNIHYVMQPFDVFYLCDKIRELTECLNHA